MNPFLNSTLDIRLQWSLYRRWKAGQSVNWPSAWYALWLVLEGQVEVWSDDNCWTVEVGQILLWPKNSSRRIVGLTDARWLSIGLSATSPSQPDLFTTLTMPGVHSPQSTDHFPIAQWMVNLIELDDYEFVPEALQDFSGQWKKSTKLRPAHFEVIEDSMVRAIFGWCWGVWGTVDLNEVLSQKMPIWLTKTLEAISEDPTVSITELAKISNFSPAQFRRLFHQNMKQAPQQYLLNYRLEIAQRLLITTNLSIDEVAICSGFSTPTNFMKLWKRARGLSALQYRLSRRISNA